MYMCVVSMFSSVHGNYGCCRLACKRVLHVQLYAQGLAILCIHVCTQTLLEEALAELDSVGGVTKVHARFYDLCSNYYKVM